MFCLLAEVTCFKESLQCGRNNKHRGKAGVTFFEWGHSICITQSS